MLFALLPNSLSLISSGVAILTARRHSKFLQDFLQPQPQNGRTSVDRPRGTPIVHGHLLMTVSALDCSMGDKTQKEKHKKDLRYEAKKAAEHEKQENREAQHHPISGHPGTAEPPASSGTIEVKGK
jgi:hypothetical protein